MLDKFITLQIEWFVKWLSLKQKTKEITVRWPNTTTLLGKRDELIRARRKRVQPLPSAGKSSWDKSQFISHTVCYLSAVKACLRKFGPKTKLSKHETRRKIQNYFWQSITNGRSNRPFARSGHMVQNHRCWWASCAVGLPKQRQIQVDWYDLHCFGSPTAQLAHQHVWFCTMWPGPLRCNQQSENAIERKAAILSSVLSQFLQGNDHKYVCTCMQPSFPAFWLKISKEATRNMYLR